MNLGAIRSAKQSARDKILELIKYYEDHFIDDSSKDEVIQGLKELLAKLLK